MDTGLNVIYTTAWLTRSGGGIPRSVTALSSALAGLGLEVDLMSLHLGERREDHVFPAAEQVRTHLYPCVQFKQLRLYWAPQFTRALQDCAGRRHAAVIHDHGLWQPTNHSAAQIARRLGIPYIVSPRGNVSPWALNHRRWKKELAWRLYVHRDLQAAQALHATSAAEARHLRRLGLRQPIAIIPNGVSVPAALPARTRAARRRTVLFLGRLHRSKGVLHLVEAWAQTRPAGWQAVIAGPDEGGTRAELEAAIAQHQLTADFHFTGPVEGQAKWELYRSADLFVLPTYSENFGISVAEALAAGVPAITTHGAPWEELERHQCGWWIPVGAEPLAAALRTATTLPEATRMDMGRRGRQLVERRFLWPNIATAMRAFYEWTLGRGARPESVELN